jgi:hypothetical protein
MAREAGFNFDGMPYTVRGNHAQLTHLESLVRADEREQGQKWFDAVTAQNKQLILAEREACAKLVDDIEARCIAKDVDDPPLEHVAAAIRARGNT